ncbi:hypothetical protein E4U41_001506 [Claviceps citrina]|nr:hypothetical protein E4U41_001506 [Claviceps citrina]
MADKKPPQSIDRLDLPASADQITSRRQPGVQPHADKAALKRKHGDENESSRTRLFGRSTCKEPAGGTSEEVESGEKPSSEDASEQTPTHWRAILAFHDMIKHPASAASKHSALDAEGRLIIALGVRNLFLATSKGGSFRGRDGQILEHMQRALGDVAQPAVVADSGLRVSFYPTTRYSELQHFQDLDARIGDHPHRNYFAQLGKTPRVFAAFVEADM